MSLEASRAAFNTAVKAAMVAWDDMMDSLGPGVQVKLVPILAEHRGVAGATIGATDGTSKVFNTAASRFVYVSTIADGSSVANNNNIVYFVPGVDFKGWPLFFYVTNDAREFE